MDLLVPPEYGVPEPLDHGPCMDCGDVMVDTNGVEEAEQDLR
jgi:hypothetical protein